MKLTEGGRLERPNVCFLCETTPGHGTKVIDTERYFDGHPYNLQGRRYVCERCINDMLKFFDFADIATVERANAEKLQAEQILRGLKLRLNTLFEDLRNITESPNILIDEVRNVSETRLGSGAMGEKPDVASDAGEADDSAGEVEVGADQESGAQGRPTAPDDTYSGASLSTSPFAQ